MATESLFGDIEEKTEVWLMYDSLYNWKVNDGIMK
jgi:hypothetical protein